jgi:hypothetical protein
LKLDSSCKFPETKSASDFCYCSSSSLSVTAAPAAAVPCALGQSLLLFAAASFSNRVLPSVENKNSPPIEKKKKKDHQKKEQNTQYPNTPTTPPVLNDALERRRGLQEQILTRAALLSGMQTLNLAKLPKTLP